MDSSYGQFVYLDHDEDNYFEEHANNVKNNMIVKDRTNYTDANFYMQNDFNGSLLIMFVQYLSNMFDYFSKK